VSMTSTRSATTWSGFFVEVGIRPFQPGSKKCRRRGRPVVGQHEREVATVAEARAHPESCSASGGPVELPPRFERVWAVLLSLLLLSQKFGRASIRLCFESFQPWKLDSAGAKAGTAEMVDHFHCLHFPLAENSTTTRVAGANPFARRCRITPGSSGPGIFWLYRKPCLAVIFVRPERAGFASRTDRREGGPAP
jgi:hypothetical protein